MAQVSPALAAAAPILIQPGSSQDLLHHHHKHNNNNNNNHQQVSRGLVAATPAPHTLDAAQLYQHRATPRDLDALRNKGLVHLHSGSSVAGSKHQDNMPSAFGLIDSEVYDLIYAYIDTYKYIYIYV